MSYEQAKNVACTLDKTIRVVLEHPETAIEDLDCCSDRDRRQIARWNEFRPTKVERCIHEVIEEQSERSPESQAVCSWDGSFTYQELDDLASRFAGHLIHTGVKAEDCIPVVFEKSVRAIKFLIGSISGANHAYQKWTVVAMLAVLKAGGAFVPLDPTHPQSRLRSLVNSVKAKHLLCSRPNFELMKSISASVFPIDGNAADSLTIDQYTQENRVQATNAAYIIFTSGSTGQPKVILSREDCIHVLKFHRAHSLNTAPFAQVQKHMLPN